MTRFLVALPSFFLAVLILIYSVYSASALEFNFASPVIAEGRATPLPDQLPSPPRILPDNPLWLAKVAGDRANVLISFSTLEKAETLARISNERLVSARVLFEQGKPEAGMATLAKAEKYLEESAKEERKARDSGVSTVGFLQKLLYTADLHSEVIESLMRYCPEDACPLVVQIANTPKLLFEDIKITLTSEGNEILSINKI